MSLSSLLQDETSGLFEAVCFRWPWPII